MYIILIIITHFCEKFALLVFESTYIPGIKGEAGLVYINIQWEGKFVGAGGGSR